MRHRSAISYCHHYDTFNDGHGSPRLAIRIAADINYLHTLQDSDGLGEGAFATRSMDHEVEHQCRQRWKIE